MTQSTSDYVGTILRSIIGIIQLTFIVLKAAVPQSAIYKWSWLKVFIPLWISLVIFVCWFYSFCFSECCLVGESTVDPPDTDIEKGNHKIIQLPTIKTSPTNKVHPTIV